MTGPEYGRKTGQHEQPRQQAELICFLCRGTGLIASPAGSRLDKWACPSCDGPDMDDDETHDPHYCD